MKDKLNPYNHYQQARYSLSLWVSYLLVGTLGFSALLFYSLKMTDYIQYSIGFGLAVINLWILIQTKKYEIAAYFISSGSFLLLTLSIILDHTVVHLIEPLWFACAIIYSYFTIGKWWGILQSIGAIGVLIYYYNTSFYSNLEFVLQNKSNNPVIMTVEAFLCFFFIGFFTVRFLKAIHFAEQNYFKANDELNIQLQNVSLQNDENAFLIKEIHHRVKNNLQIIVSMLRLQSYEMKTDEAKQNFEEAINRIMSMALIHQKMYEQKNLQYIDVNSYLQDLIRDLIRNYSTHEQKIDVHIHNEMEQIGLKTIVPLGLLMSELVSNSLKHAITHDGTISIQIKNNTNHHYTLLYADSGTWKENSKKGFGLEMIDTLVEQLEGTIERENTNGTIYHIEFKDID